MFAHVGGLEGRGIQSEGSEARLPGFEASSTATHCVTLGRVLNLSAFECSHVLSGCSSGVYFQWLFSVLLLLFGGVVR